MKNARPPEGKPSAREQGYFKAPAQFLGTSNPRYLRILAALMTRPRTREEVDRIAGASNGPAAIAELRALGLPGPDCLSCQRVPCFDRDGEEVKRGVYSFTAAGRRRVYAWMRARKAARGGPNE